MTTTSEAWQDCHFLRHLSRDESVIRLAGTGAILCVNLAVPLEAARACMVSALRPAPGRVLLGELCANHTILGCQLEVEWPAQAPMPPPARFLRRPPTDASRRKRRRRPE